MSGVLKLDQGTFLGKVGQDMGRAKTGGGRKQRTVERDEDFAAFERILAEGRERYDMRILAYCLLSIHWHWVLWPKRDGDLSRFVGWVTLTHTQRWHAYRHSTGSGHVYQGRVKSFPNQMD
jgi:putative transposase